MKGLCQAVINLDQHDGFSHFFKKAIFIPLLNINTCIQNQLYLLKVYSTVQDIVSI